MGRAFGREHCKDCGWGLLGRVYRRESGMCLWGRMFQEFVEESVGRVCGRGSLGGGGDNAKAVGG